MLRKLLFAAVIALLAALLPAKDATTPSTGGRRSENATKPSQRAGSEKNGPWETIRNAKLIDNPWNDGDSFHVLANGTHRVFRLYFVDTPETDRSLSDRIKTQAAYFNIPPTQVSALGEKAAAVSESLLKGKSLTIHTRWRDALGRSKLGRYYALIEVDGKDLGGLLVQQGLARVYGMKTDLPDGSDAARMTNRLQQLEREAKSKKAGAWGLGAKSLN
jgi:endonuclease YncB( thermonuclease family)